MAAPEVTQLRLPHSATQGCAKLCTVHDDVKIWKHFPYYWPFVRGIPSQRASNEGLHIRCWELDQTVQTIELSVIWDVCDAHVTYNVSITLHCVEGDRNLGYWVAPIIHIAFYEDITWCYVIYERLCSNVAQDFAPKAHKLGGHRCSVIRSRPAGNYTWIKRGMIIVHIYTTMVVTSRRGWYHQN